MTSETHSPPTVHRRAFCIFVDSLCEGPTPSVRGEGSLPFVFASRVEAEREIIETMIDRMTEFLGGTRDFDDATTMEEYVVEVDVLPDGQIVCDDGQIYGSD